MPLLLYSYILVTWLILPFMWLFFRWRTAQGREDKNRLNERKGFPSHARPAGALIWFHGASVGEVNSILPLIESFLKNPPHNASVLLTSGTITSTQIVQNKKIKGLLHQYVPMDQPLYARRFLKHWRPDMVVFVESELWPNLLGKAYNSKIPIMLVNARMSGASFQNWLRAPDTIKKLMSYFTTILTQDSLSKERIEKLGGQCPHASGNLKLDAPPLNYDKAELQHLKRQLSGRQCWLGASTHQNEEIQIAQTHKTLSVDMPELLTIIVPRHPQRGAHIREQLEAMALRVCQRSKSETPKADCDIYLADTLGELGLFYRLCDISFIGGSLMPHGGQNPIEAALVGCAIVTGPHTYNFTSIYKHLEDNQGMYQISDNIELTSTLNRLIKNTALLDSMKQKAMQTAQGHGGANEKTLKILSDIFSTHMEKS